MVDLGSEEPALDNKGNPIYTTICHGGNNKKLYYYHESFTFTCYTSCGGGKDVYQVVIDAKTSQGFKFTFPDALKYVSEITGKRIVSSEEEKSNNIVDDFNWINKFRKKPQPIAQLPSYNENVLDVFMPYLDFWHDEGITKETAEKYEIGYYFKENQIVFANRSDDGRLIGIRSRNLDDEKVDSGLKYLPTTVGGNIYSFPSAFNLFGLNHTKDNIRRLKKCLIFEGEKSVLKAEEVYGNDNFTVAVLGSSISSWHRDKILSLGVEEVFIAFDKFRAQKKGESDEFYNKRILDYQKKLIRLARMFTVYARVYILWDDEELIGYKDSPIDCGQKSFEKLMKNKYEITTYETKVE